MHLLDDAHRYQVLVGGAGSGKSIFCGQKVILMWLLSNEKQRILLTRKVNKTIRNSQYQLLKDLIFEYNLEPLFTFKDSDMRIVCKNGNELLSVGVDDPEKLKSIQGITKCWIEEATELSEGDFTQLDLRLRGKGVDHQFMLSFNPIDEHHWLNSYFFLRRVPDAITLHTTYQDNKFIDAKYKSILEGIRDPNMRQIYLEGRWGVLKNIIYEPFEMLGKYPDSFDDKFYGLDFGYNNPSALIEIGIKDREIYPRQLIYKSGMLTRDLIKEMERLEVSRDHTIYADAAEPGRIREIYEAGFDIRKANKAVNDGIDHLKSVKIYTLPENVDLNKERQSYKWKEDKEGVVYDAPVKFMDHALDALRYGVYTYHKQAPIEDIAAW